jgi:TPR repeat protein
VRCLLTFAELFHSSSAVGRLGTVALLVYALTALATMNLEAADQWIELKSPHFIVTSNAGQSSTRDLAWQLEQIRSAVAELWPWARVDLDRPVAVLAVKDEASMRALAPQYWEEKGGVRPGSVWVSGPDQHYIAIRADLKAEDNVNINPHVTAYFAYVSLILRQSVDRNFPLWFTRGLSGVLSNTVIRNTHLLLGPPIPWHLQRLRTGSRLLVPALVKVTPSSPEFTSGEGLSRFDAQAWALVHFLMFGDRAAHRPKLDRFSTLVSRGTHADVAMREALGPPEDLEGPYVNYINRSLFTFQRVNIDVSVKREGFAVRPLGVAESASLRALFHAATLRPVEARAAIDEARKADPAVPNSHLADALLLERDNKPDEARAAYGRAVDGGSTSAYAHYRLASLLWRPQPGRDALEQIEKLLARSTALNNRYAAAYAYLGDVRSMLQPSEGLPLVRRAISLEPSDPDHRLAAARVLWRQHAYAEALKEAQAAQGLAVDPDDRRKAQEMIQSVERATRETAAARPPAALQEGSDRPGSTLQNRAGPTPKCQAGDTAACAALLPIAEAECAKKNGAACAMAGALYERGWGVAADAGRAAALLRQACDAGDRRGCVGFAAMQARGAGVQKDEVRAVSLLEETCNEGLLEGCAQLGALLASRASAPDLARARELLAKSCDGKYAPACELLKGLAK